MEKLDLSITKNASPEIQNKAISIDILRRGSFNKKRLALEKLLLAGTNNKDLLGVVAGAIDYDNETLSKQTLVNSSETNTHVGNKKENQPGTELALTLEILTSKNIIEEKKSIFIKTVISDLVSGPDGERVLDKILKSVEKNISKQSRRIFESICIDVMAK